MMDGLGAGLGSVGLWVLWRVIPTSEGRHVPATGGADGPGCVDRSGPVHEVGGSGTANNSADAGLVFKKFLSLCQQAGPARCALAGQGPVAPRARALLARLRRGPIPAPSAPSRQLSYGDTLIALWLTLGTPETWPNLATELNQAADGDGSGLANVVADNETLLQEALVPSTALQCADKPLPRPGEINRWPAVIDRLRPQGG